MITADLVPVRLVEAANAATLVRITRSPRHADRVDGFVHSVGTKWVLVSQTSHGGFFDGLVAVRLKDIVEIEHDLTFEGRFARTQPEWPPAAPEGVSLDSTRGLIQTLSQVSPLIGIEQERRHKHAMTWIGVVHEVKTGWLWLREVRPDATWRKQPRGYKMSRITMVAVSDQYQTALAGIAGPSPKSGLT